MPATPVTFSNLEQLIERIAMHMTANGAGENTGERTQQLLMEIVLGVLAISGSAPEGAASIQPWSAGLEYTEQVLVSHNGFLWLYAGGAANTGTEPGTDASLWMSLGAPPAPSLQDVLAVGNRTGSHDIGVDAGQVIGFRDTVSDGLLKLSHEPITDDNELLLPNKSGTLATTDDLPDLTTLNLHEVLVNGNETDGRSVQVSEGDGVNFLQGSNYVRVKAPAVAAAARTLLLPDKSGTVATTDDVAAVAALVDGTMRAPEAYTPAGGLYPATYDGSAIQKGDTFRVGAGTMGSVTVNAEDLLIALVDAPGQTDANWQVIESNRVVATQAEAEDSASTDLAKLVPPQRWWQAWTKGLTLTAFGSAVRGMLLNGYTVGANAAVAATDSIMGAVAKLQGQINATNTAVGGKLAKASNLSDLTNADTARGNLGLGMLAVEDYADALIMRVPVDAGVDDLKIGDCVCINASGGAVFATPALADKGKVMVVVEPMRSQVRLQMAGYCECFSGLAAGKAYYLDPALPGKITSIRPAMHSVYVGVAIGSRSIILAPDMPLPSGSAVLAADEVTDDAYGKNTDLKTPELAPGLYDVTVQAQVSTVTGAGRGVLWLGLAAAGDARGMTAIALDDKTGTVYTDVGLTTKSAAIHDIGDGGVTEQTIRALVNISGKTGITVCVAPRVGGYNATLMAGSVMTWNRIG